MQTSPPSIRHPREVNQLAVTQQSPQFWFQPEFFHSCRFEAEGSEVGITTVSVIMLDWVLRMDSLPAVASAVLNIQIRAPCTGITNHGHDTRRVPAQGPWAMCAAFLVTTVFKAERRGLLRDFERISTLPKLGNIDELIRHLSEHGDYLVLWLRVCLLHLGQKIVFISLRTNCE